MQQEPKRPMEPMGGEPGMVNPQGQQQEASGQPSTTGQLDKSAQTQFDMFMVNGIKIVHSKPFTDSVIQAARSQAKDPGKIIDVVAHMTVTVVSRLEASATERGIKLKDEVKLNAANFLMSEIINIAETAGTPKLDDEQKAQAFSLAISLYLDQAVKSGKMTPQQVQQLAEQAKQTPEGQKIEQTRAEIKAKGQGPNMQGGAVQKPHMSGGGGLVAPKGGM